MVKCREELRGEGEYGTGGMWVHAKEDKAMRRKTEEAWETKTPG